MEEYHYTECGLNNIYLANGFEITKLNDGDEEIFIHNIHGLHEAICKTLLAKETLLSSREIEFIKAVVDFRPAEFLGHKKNKEIYSIINQIADLDAKSLHEEKANKITFKESSHQWQVVA